MKSIFAALSLIVLGSLPVLAGETAETLAGRIVSEDPSQTQTAVKALREMKQTGLDALFKVYRNEIETYKKTGRKPADWDRVAAALDAVAMQKDAYAAGLFWHTDLEKARLEAFETDKPILSLRLLGNLNEEYSCANSRFFRSILYTNPKIARELREKYVLHWQSVRPAPKVTIDYGDGRKLVSTITGNSIHYVLDKDGRIIDALPGLYLPDSFHRYLARIVRIRELGKNSRRKVNWEAYQKERQAELYGFWQNDLEKLGYKIDRPVPEIDPAVAPTALEAAPRAVTKMASEFPTVSEFVIRYDEKALREKTRLEDMFKIAESFSLPEFDPASRQFIRHKTGGADNLSDEEFSRLIAKLNKHTAIDTVQNEYLFHTKIYEWLIEGETVDVEKFNEKVYAELFLTPDSDKWLGLYSSDIYLGIDGNGLKTGN